MLEFSLLSSGSAGNATLVSSGAGSLLIDNGLSLRELLRRLALVGRSLDDLQGVVVTHEHGDHVRGIGVLARKHDVPVYLTPATYDRLPQSVGRIPRVQHFMSGDVFRVGDFTLTSFRVAHDAADPVSFVIESGGARLGFATDLGSVSHLVRQRLRGAHALVLESNHCPDMLRRSAYPPQVVQRIRGPHGHLSNQDMNSLLADVMHSDLQLVVAVHVSQENNTEEKARSMAARVLRDHPAQLVIAAQDVPSPVYRVTAPGTSAMEAIA